MTDQLPPVDAEADRLLDEAAAVEALISGLVAIFDAVEIDPDEEIEGEVWDFRGGTQ